MEKQQNLKKRSVFPGFQITNYAILETVIIGF